MSHLMCRMVSYRELDLALNLLDLGHSNRLWTNPFYSLAKFMDLVAHNFCSYRRVDALKKSLLRVLLIKTILHWCGSGDGFRVDS